ncbi:MAG TPA: MEDS domain-containing protein [Jiangellales bacterium]|nr:MEDS domain-containing protein [Jiangellales bacterium]
MTGTTGSPTRYGHVCWSYDDPAEFDCRARAFLAAGLASGEQIWYVTPDRADDAVERLRGVDGFQEALHRGAAKIVALGSSYAYDHIVDPPEQVRAYAAATEAALAAGYTGLRVVAEATSLVRTPAQLDAFTRYEHLIDRYMRTHPMSAMCGYDRRALGDSVIAQLACMHQHNNADEVLFRLHACDPGDGCAALAGELDLFNHELFSTALDRADLRPTGGELVVEATNLRFIDHRSLFRLQELARRRAATVVLRMSGSAAARLVDLLDLSQVRVEAAR